MDERTHVGVRLERNPSAVWRMLLDGVLVQAPDGVDPLKITTPGDLIWQLLARPITASELIERMAELHHTTAEVVRVDVETLISAMREADVLRVAPGQAE